jgi:multidrug resistance efflux pump
MLNISKNSVSTRVNISHYESFKMVQSPERSKRIRQILWGVAVVLLGLLFMPWTQNIRAKGYLTALKPEQRPQTIQSVIGGRIEKWYVQEGDFVEKGDTILFISEIKDEYFDPELVSRMDQQIKAKQQAVVAYSEKITALERQIKALEANNKVKRMQAQNKLLQAGFKVESDSMNLEAVKINFEVAKQQFARMEELFKDGLRSLTEYETRKLRFQQDQASLIASQNNLLSSRNELLNAQMELAAIDNDFMEKLAKANSERSSAMSNLFEAEGTVAKMQNQMSNYQIRVGMYYIIAPQSGYVTQAVRVGIGENIKEGTEIISIMPEKYDLAVEMYIDPVDLPLIRYGNKVRFIFDGWPAIVFSGWPQLSNGTFGGKVFAIDRFISLNGKYRVLVVPDPEEEEWPEALRVGSGAEGIALLQDVPIWYEIWRQLNGFPADYYFNGETAPKAKK